MQTTDDLAILRATFPRASRRVLETIHDHDPASVTELESYAWPGGYPIYYLTDPDNSVLCPDCATRLARDPDERETVAAYGIQEDSSETDLICDACGKTIYDADLPDADAITTPDDRRFYQYGKLVLELTDDDDRDSHLRAYMDAQQFWPEVWSLSDHGNWTRIDIPPREVDAIRVDLNYASIGEADDDETHAFWCEYRAELGTRLRQRYADADEIIVTYDDRSTGVTREPLIIATSPDAEAAARAELEYLQSTLFAELLREWES